MGRMNSNLKKIIIANLALIQVQAIIVAFLASGFAVTLAWIPKGQVILLISESNLCVGLLLLLNFSPTE